MRTGLKLPALLHRFILHHRPTPHSTAKQHQVAKEKKQQNDTQKQTKKRTQLCLLKKKVLGSPPKTKKTIHLTPWSELPPVRLSDASTSETCVF